MIELPRITSTKGSLTVCEEDDLPFIPRRWYWLYDMPGGADRGAHAHRELWQVIWCLQGGFFMDLTSRDGTTSSHYMKYPWEGVVIPPGTWRDLYNFEPGTVALVAADRPYEEADYIRDFDEFMA